jgi:hypothetical protein
MAEETKQVENKEQEKLLAQSQVDAIVQDRLARERAKFSDYEDLKKFRSEHEKQLEAATQKELEARKEYDKLKEGWTKKEQELYGMVTKKDQEIQDMRVSSALVTEITRQNAYAEETMALLKSQAVFDKEGNIRVKGRDVNGLEVLHSVEEGVKNFLTQRPHLVKATQRNGGGTPPATNTGGNSGADDLTSLSTELAQAHARGDHKKAGEIKTKLQTALTAARRGV